MKRLINFLLCIDTRKMELEIELRQLDEIIKRRIPDGK
jgi:hypothetical protein